MKTLAILTASILFLFGIIGIYLGIDEGMVPQFWVGFACLVLAVANILEAGK